MTVTAPSQPATPTHADAPWVAVIANPFSGRKSNQPLVARLVDELWKHDLAAHIAWQPEERRQLLAKPQEMQRRCRCVVVAGGDGTVADVISLAPSAPLAVLPLGNENLFARQFGHTRGPEALARAIAHGKTTTVDVGRAGDRSFGLMVSAGFDARVVHQLARWRSAQATGLRRVTRLSYVVPTLGAFCRYDYPTLALEADDGQRVTGRHAFVFNIPQYAGGLPLIPQARCDDGLLDWVVLEKPGRLALVHYLWSVYRRRHLQLRHVRHGAARHIRITATGAPVPLQIDGDPAGDTPVEIHVVPRAIQVIVAT